LVGDIPARDGKMADVFLQCMCEYGPGKYKKLVLYGSVHFAIQTLLFNLLHHRIIAKTIKIHGSMHIAESTNIYNGPTI
jgi:hypothetical protein